MTDTTENQAGSASPASAGSAASPSASAILDRAQVLFFEGQDSDLAPNGKLSEWFNSCLNSACGPIASRYGDVALAELLKLWADTVRERAVANATKPS